MKLPGTEDYKSALQFAKEVKNILGGQSIPLGEEQNFSFYLYIPDKDGTQACVEILENMGMEVEINEPDNEDDRYLCIGNLTMQPTSAALHDVGEVLVKLAQKHNGEFESWDIDNEILHEAFDKFFDELLEEIDDEELDDFFTPPSQIHLEVDPEPAWLAQDDISQIINEIKELGFSSGKSYIIKETPQVSLHSLFKADSTIYCIVCKADDAPPWVEFHVIYEDKTDISVSNVEGKEHFNELPASREISCPRKSIAELYRELHNQLEPKPILKVHPWNFKNLVEKSYKKTMQWRNQRGGLTFEEFKSHMDMSELADNELLDFFIDFKYRELRKWHYECVNTFADLNGLPDDIDELYDNLFIVSDKFEPNSFLDYLVEFIDVPEDLLDPDNDISGDYADTMQLFFSINNEQPDGERAIKAGAISFPLQVDIYRASYYDSNF